MQRELKLRLIVERPPKDVDYALQKGRGNTYETVQKQRSNGSDLTFEFNVEVRTGTNNLSGPFVQGPPDGRFVYLDIGTMAGQADSPWSRRLKVPLTGITGKMIDASDVLETRVPGTGKDGGPTCATVKPFDGWKSGQRTR